MRSTTGPGQPQKSSRRAACDSDTIWQEKAKFALLFTFPAVCAVDTGSSSLLGSQRSSSSGSIFVDTGAAAAAGFSSSAAEATDAKRLPMWQQAAVGSALQHSYPGGFPAGGGGGGGGRKGLGVDASLLPYLQQGLPGRMRQQSAGDRASVASVAAAAGAMPPAARARKAAAAMSVAATEKKRRDERRMFSFVLFLGLFSKV